MNSVSLSLAGLIHSERVNTTLGWISIIIVALGAFEGFVTNAYLWAGLTVLIAVIAAAPVLITGDWSAMVPWVLPFVAAMAVVLRANNIYPEITGYVAIGSLALILVVELDVFTGVEFSRRFAIVFAALTTMALQALWTIAQYYSDRWFMTEFLHSQTELQWDFVFVTLVGITLGVLTEWYFQRFQPIGSFERPPSR